MRCLLRSMDEAGSVHAVSTVSAILSGWSGRRRVRDERARCACLERDTSRNFRRLLFPRGLTLIAAYGLGPTSINTRVSGIEGSWLKPTPKPPLSMASSNALAIVGALPSDDGDGISRVTTETPVG